MKRIVVTGGCGLLGEHVVAEISGSFDVTVLDIAEPKARASLAGCAHHRCDVLDRDKVVRLMADHDAVIHLAGIDVAIAASDAAYFETNVMGTWNVLHAAELAGHAKAVICSSISAAGFTDEQPIVGPDQLPATEQQPLRPTHPYGLSKQVMEVVGKSFAERGKLKVVALRPALIVFPHILEEVVRSVSVEDSHKAGDATSEDVSRDSLSPTRSWVSPGDVARCFRQALEADTDCYDEFFVLAADTYSPENTLDGIARRFGYLPPVSEPKRFDNNPRAAAISNEKAQRILNWRPQSDWPTFVTETRRHPT